MKDKIISYIETEYKNTVRILKWDDSPLVKTHKNDIIKMPLPVVMEL